MVSLISRLLLFLDEVSAFWIGGLSAALNQFTGHASGLPDGGVFRKAIWQHLQDFHDLYSNWSDVQGADNASRARRAEIIR